MFVAIAIGFVYVLILAGLALALVYFVGKRIEDKKKETFEKREN